MRIQPRGQLLDIWRAVVASSLSAQGEWVWGGRDGSDSVADAHQLLCLMFPATELAGFRLDIPAGTDAEVLTALQGLGDAVEIPRRLARICLEYLMRHTSGDQTTPSFAGRISSEQEHPGLDVVESYAVSVTLTTSMLGFARILRRSEPPANLVDELDELEARATRRLNAAMVGLLRSFCIGVFDVESRLGEQLLRMVNQTAMTRRRVVDGLHDALRANAAGWREAILGIEAVRDLADHGVLYEVGWSWGPTVNAPEVETVPSVVQRAGSAEALPYLYFTAVALDGIIDLFTDRTRILGLLDDEQQRLARALRLRWDLTQQYWATLATFGTGRWPIEDIPWHTTDGVTSEYMSLLVTSIAIRDLGYRRDADRDLARIGQVLRELGVRGRITRKPLRDDPALALHHPGHALSLNGTAGTGLTWFAADYAPLLLKRTLQVAERVNDIDLRDDLLTLAGEVWGHLLDRRIGTGPGRGLWDQPGHAFAALPAFDLPSWYHTYRVVECLVVMTNVVERPPLRSEPLAAQARHLLAEAEHLHAQLLLDDEAAAGERRDNAAAGERLDGAAAAGERLDALGRRLEQARGLVPDSPARATAVLIGVLQELDALATARPGG